jgi:hypothetical protein
MTLLTIRHLPNHIREVLVSVMMDIRQRGINPEDPCDADGRCVVLSEDLIRKFTEKFIDSRMVGTSTHAFVKVEDYYIDLTARQFNPMEPYPKIWIHSENKPG